MDPGTAIGLAGTVYKVVIAGIEFLGDAKQVYAKGGTEDNLDLDASAQDIQSASASLEDQLDRAKAHVKSSDGESQLNTEDEELRQLAVRASSIGKELSEALGKAHISEKSKFKAFKAVIRKNWDADDIKKIESRLNGVRSELQLKVLVSIRRNLDGPQNEPYKPMLATLESLVNHQAQSAEDRRRMMESLSRTEELTMLMKDELLESRQQILTELRTSQPSLMISYPGCVDEKVARRRVEDAILASLWYSTIDDRMESITDAHKKTFEWLLRDPAASEVPFNSLVEFLSTDTGKAYWITGKPGSGKSTAMKFLLDDPRTDQLLQRWSGGKTVLKAPFYFFYNGTEMQKSELGLLSTLLYTLLQQERKLIQVGFKGRFEAALGGQSAAGKPSIFEGRRALKEIVRCNPDIFFFLAVDGLDEFDPRISTTDVGSLLQLTRSLSSFSNAKMIMSSRPLSAFERGFADCPSLAIHALTHGDIQSYVFDELHSHPRMKTLMSRDEPQTRSLIRSISDNSSGVFLWVRLVVQSLLEGLENSDGFKELQDRLEELPQDLHTLYSVILSRIRSSYVPQTAKLIQIVEKGTENQLELSLLGLWYADQWTDQDLFDAPLCPISQNQIVTRTEDMKGRLKSRCLGLIDIQPSSATDRTIWDPKRKPNSNVYDSSNNLLMLSVKFVHRTVSEFLANKDVRTQFVDLPSLSTFDPGSALERSAVAMIKEFIPGKPKDWAVLINMVSYAGRRFEMNPVDPSRQLKLLNELDNIMSEHKTKQLVTQPDSMGPKHGFAEEASLDAHWSSWLDRAAARRLRDFKEIKKHGTVFLREIVPWQGRRASFLSFLVMNSLDGVLHHLVKMHGPSILHKDGLSLLGYALCFSWSWCRPVVFVIPEIVKLLVDNGISPHDEFHGVTVWDWYLRTKDSSGYTTWDDVPGVRIPSWVSNPGDIKAILALLGAGANVNGRIAWSEPGLPQESPRPETKTTCTLLLAARRCRQLTIVYENIHVLKKTMEFMKEMLGQIIKLLEDGKAVEQEWDFEGNLIMPLKDMKNGVIESASHSSRTDPDDETIAVHMSRTRESKVRGKLSSWVKSLTGKAKTAT